MSFWSEYVAYIKDNPQGYWFKSKVYGWGWVPATREGWLTLAIFVAVLAFLIVPFSKNPQPSDQDVFLFLGEVLLWVIVLLFICYKTGEPLRWRWGIPDKEDRQR
jgi:hypothetical protein